jgi:hypothetical protein
MAKLRAMTNLQVVEDSSSPSGYKLDVGPFPGWKDAPERWGRVRAHADSRPGTS